MARLVALAVVAVVALSPAPAQGAAKDEAAVKAVVTSFQDCWNRHDMDCFAALFAEDADFVNVIGMRWVGREEIKQVHVALHTGPFKDSRLTVGETTVRFLAPDVAVTRSTWDLVGHAGPEGRAGTPRKGILTNVLVRKGDRWEIAVTQNTDIVMPQPR